MDSLDPLYLLLLALLAIAAIVIVHRRSVRNAGTGDGAESDMRDVYLRNAFDRATLGIAFLNGEGQWLDANRRFTAALGYTKPELGNVPLRLMTHAEDRKREASLFAELRSGKRSGYAITKRLQRKSGEYRTFRVQMIRCSEFPVPVYQCSIDDGEQQATRLELISAALGDLDQTAVIFCDSSGAVSGWNRGAEELFGYTETEIVGKPWAVLHREGTAATAAKLVTSAAQHGFTRTFSSRLRKDATTVAVRSVLVPDLRGRESAGFLEFCYAEATAAATIPVPHAAAHVPANVEHLRADNAHLREELERHLTAVRQLAEIHKQNEALRQRVEQKTAAETQLRELVTTLRAANNELTRKVRILSGAVRKMVTARKAEPALVALPVPLIAEDLDWSSFRGAAVNDTVRRIAEREETGVLQLRSGSAEKRLVFQGGRLVAITSDNDDRLLGQLLVDAGLIDDEQRTQVLDSHRSTGIPFGSSIVRMGLATEDDIAEIIRSKAKRELEDAATWDEGEAAFAASEPRSDLMPLAVDILAVLTELAPELSTDLSPSEEEIAEVVDEVTVSPATVPDSGTFEPLEAPVAAVAVAVSEVDATPAAPLPFVGRASSKGRIFHAKGCKSAKTIPKKQRVYFESAAEGVNEGFKACMRCLPARDAERASE